MFNIEQAIAQLIGYANCHLFLKDEDNIYTFNRLADKLGLSSINPPQSFPKEQSIIKSKAAHEITSVLLEYALSAGIIKAENAFEFEYELLSLVIPTPSFILEYFDSTASSYGFREACDFLYNFTLKSNYVDKRQLENNINWIHEAKKGRLTLTINACKNSAKSDLACPLCAQNLGKKGSHAILRSIPIPLGNEEWLFQFSPFGYLNEHFNLVSAKHEPLKIDGAMFTKMTDFLEYAPFYFVGANNELPNVGASNPHHSHLIGGKEQLPVFSAKSRIRLSSPLFPRVRIKVLDWYTDVIRLESSDVRQLASAAEFVRSAWCDYSDKTHAILSQIKGVQQNGVTVLAFVNQENEYTIDLYLRNNSEDFSIPKNLAFVKSTPLGVLEMAGFLILPHRLVEDLAQVRTILEEGANFAKLSASDNPLSIYLPLIAQLANDLATNGNEKYLEEMIQDYLNLACEQILFKSAVFGETEQGEKAFLKFLKHAKLLNIEY